MLTISLQAVTGILTVWIQDEQQLMLGATAIAVSRLLRIVLLAALSQKYYLPIWAGY